MTLIKEKKISRNKLNYIDSFLNTVAYFFESNGLWNLGFAKTDDSSSKATILNKTEKFKA